MSDPQRQRVYAAEHIVTDMIDRAKKGEQIMTICGSNLVMPDTEKLISTDAAALTYITHLAGLPLSKHLGCSDPPTVRFDGRRTSGVYRWIGEIHLPDGRWGRREFTILHEFAHHLTQGEAHGPRFCGALHGLVAEMLGPVPALALAEAFEHHEVKVHYAKETP